MNHPRMKEVVDDVYIDHEARFSIDEARELHEHYKPLANRFMSNEQWTKLIQTQNETLDYFLNDHPAECSHFVVAFYEWDSGM